MYVNVCSKVMFWVRRFYHLPQTEIICLNFGQWRVSISTDDWSKCFVKGVMGLGEKMSS